MKAAFLLDLFKAILPWCKVDQNQSSKAMAFEKGKEKLWPMEVSRRSPVVRYLASIDFLDLQSEDNRISCNAESLTLRQTTPSTKAFEALSMWLKPSTDDGKFWWHTIGGPLAILLHEAGYEIHDQYGSLMFLYCYVIDFLGPRPTVAGLPRLWKSFMTDDFTPVEYSWSWDTPNASPRIRFSIEAIGPAAGTKRDPFNQEMTREMIRRLRSVLPDADWKMFNHFRDGLCGEGLQDDGCVEDSGGRIENPDNQSSHSSTFIAFEMYNMQIAVKAYFVPVKAEQTGRSKLSILSETIRGLEGPNFQLTSYDHLLDFMTNHAEGSLLDIVGVAVDCVIPWKSRLKIYVRSARTSFDSVHTIMSMGGKLQTFPQASLQDFRKLWQLTLGLDENFSSSSDLSLNPRQTAGILYNFDIRAGTPLPEPKVYIPVKHYSPNDQVAMTGLTSYLKMKGQDGFAEGYQRALAGISNHRDLESESGLQTYVSCAVKKERLVLTSYFSPEIYHKARW